MTNAPAIAGSSFPSFPALAAVDPTRVAAGSGTLAINAAILLLLLAPIAAPLVSPPPPREISVVPIAIPRIPPKVVDPVPVRIEREKPLARPTTTPERQRVEQTRDVPTPVFDDRSSAMDVPALDHHVEPARFDRGEPVSAGVGAQLQHLSAPPPAYPRQALRDGLTGTVMLEVLVDVDGRPLEVRIARSSGHRELDQAARRQVLTRWRFRPAMLDGQAVQAIGLVPVDFSLD